MEENLPPGFRFHPTDEELITQYLCRKVSDTGFTGKAVVDVDLNKCEPWDLPVSSNGKSTISGYSNSEKPKGVDADSFPGPIKPTRTPYFSSSLTIGDPHSKKAKGAASVSSSLTTPNGKTAVSYGVSIGVPKSKNPNGTIVHTTKTGASSGVRGKAAVSSSVKGKAIVSAKVGEVMAFKDVKFGLMKAS